MEKECIFCLENRKKFLLKNGYDVNGMYFYEDDSFSISSDMAPMVIGHLIVITKNHYSSFAEVANTSIMQNIEKIVSKLLGTDDLLFFEHGAVVEGKAGVSVDHAHLHVMPRPEEIDVCSIDNYIKSSGYIDSDKIIIHNQTLHSLYVNKQPYIYYKVQSQQYAYCVDSIPHQFLRRMLQSFCPISYDWRKTFLLDENKKNVEETIHYIRRVSK